MDSFKDIIGFEQYYSINRNGDVYSKRSGRLIKNYLNGNGYPFVTLSVKGRDPRKKHTLLHRLIAIHFIPNPDNKEEVNHINGIRKDHRIENLEWVTSSENHLHSIRVLNNPKPPSYKGNTGDKHHSSVAVYMYDKDGKFLQRYGSQKECGRETGINFKTVYWGVNSGRLTHRKYYFLRYKK